MVYVFDPDLIRGLLIPTYWIRYMVYSLIWLQENSRLEKEISDLNEKWLETWKSNVDLQKEVEEAIHVKRKVNKDRHALNITRIRFLSSCSMIYFFIYIFYCKSLLLKLFTSTSGPFFVPAIPTIPSLYLLGTIFSDD